MFIYLFICNTLSVSIIRSIFIFSDVHYTVYFLFQCCRSTLPCSIYLSGQYMINFSIHLSHISSWHWAESMPSSPLGCKVCIHLLYIQPILYILSSTSNFFSIQPIPHIQLRYSLGDVPRNNTSKFFPSLSLSLLQRSIIHDARNIIYDHGMKMRCGRP